MNTDKVAHELQGTPRCKDPSIDSINIGSGIRLILAQQIIDAFVSTSTLFKAHLTKLTQSA